MKKIAKIIVASVLFLMPFAVMPTASAANYTCEIGYTGPDSYNKCVSKETQVCTIVNKNKVTIDNNNDQLSISGDGLNLDNTTTGSSTSGSATNTNNENFIVTVTNNGENGNACVAAKVVPAKAVPEEAKPAAPAEEVTPTVLPNTSSDVFSTALTVVAVLLGLSATGLFLGVTAYRLFQTKS